MTQNIDKRPTLQIVFGAFLLLFLGGIVAWSLKVGPSFWPLRGGSQKSLEGPGDFGTVPDFSLVERSKRTFNLHELRGKIWIANFIFTTCTETCPTQSAALAGLQSDLDLKGKIKLVSITVDPKRDTPEVLSQYASRFGAHPDQWFFLTGKQEEIYRLAILDGLTGVHNKRYFLEFLERELASSQRHGHPLTLVMFDIDHFKALNDTRGHLAGDHVLRTLSSRIQTRMRREDLLARYGGEEFAAVLNSTDLTGGIRFAEDVRRRIEAAPFEFGGESFTITVSLGVAAVANEQGVDPAALIARADKKLYAAKCAGRNRVVG